MTGLAPNELLVRDVPHVVGEPALRRHLERHGEVLVDRIDRMDDDTFVVSYASRNDARDAYELLTSTTAGRMIAGHRIGIERAGAPAHGGAARAPIARSARGAPQPAPERSCAGVPVRSPVDPVAPGAVRLAILGWRWNAATPAAVLDMLAIVGVQPVAIVRRSGDNNLVRVDVRRADAGRVFDLDTMALPPPLAGLAQHGNLLVRPSLPPGQRARVHADGPGARLW